MDKFILRIGSLWLKAEPNDLDGIQLTSSKDEAIELTYPEAKKAHSKIFNSYPSLAAEVFYDLPVRKHKYPGNSRGSNHELY
jgi:hypothetical protein